MSNNLPTRPNLDHLRKQAKDLLAAFKDSDPVAVREVVEYLPAASGLTEDRVTSIKLALGDAQSVIARKHGFASWERLSRHVAGLRAIEGTWHFTSLRVEGMDLPAGAFSTSSMELYGNSFRMTSPDADYVGAFELDVEAQPSTVDIRFTEGPEVGNTALGIYRFDGEELTFCLSLVPDNRPVKFASEAGSGHALETLRRGAPASAEPKAETGTVVVPTEGFGEVTSEMELLQGEWAAVSINRHGMPLPAHMLSTGRRKMVGAESVVSFGGNSFMEALTRVDATQNPPTIDYLLTSGPNEGKVQLGIMAADGDEVQFCFAEPGQPRPDRFEVPSGADWTHSVWKRL